MASIITATTTSGLTQSADNSGVLQLASGTGNLVTIPSVTGTAMVSGNMPAFGAIRTNSQSVTTSTWTKVSFDSEEFDTNNNFSSSRFTPTVAGYYQINGSIYGFGTAGVTRIIIAIYKNGSQFKNGNYMPPITTDSLRGQAVVSSLIYLNGSTDYVELYGFVTASSSPSFEGDSTGIQLYMNGFLARTA